MESTVLPIPQKPLHSSLLYTPTSLDELVSLCFLAHLGILNDSNKLSIINKFINHLIKLHCHENLQFLIDIYVYDYYFEKYDTRLKSKRTENQPQNQPQNPIDISKPEGLSNPDTLSNTSGLSNTNGLSGSSNPLGMNPMDRSFANGSDLSFLLLNNYNHKLDRELKSGSTGSIKGSVGGGKTTSKIPSSGNEFDTIAICINNKIKSNDTRRSSVNDCETIRTSAKDSGVRINEVDNGRVSNNHNNNEIDENLFEANHNKGNPNLLDYVIGGDRIDDDIEKFQLKFDCGKDCTTYKSNCPCLTDSNQCLSEFTCNSIHDCVVNKSIDQYKSKVAAHLQEQDFQFENSFYHDDELHDLDLDLIDSQTLINQWNLIINNYIINDSPNQINISQPHYKSILKEHRLDRIHNPQVLLVVKQEIMNLLRENAYYSFKEKNFSPIHSINSPINSINSTINRNSPINSGLNSRTSPISLNDLKLKKIDNIFNRSSNSDFKKDSIPKSLSSQNSSVNTKLTTPKASSTQISPITSPKYTDVKFSSTQVSPTISSIDLDLKSNLSSFKQKLHKKFTNSPIPQSPSSSAITSSSYLSNFFGHLKLLGSSSTSPTLEEMCEAKDDKPNQLKFWKRN
jgi:hypothetical protein